MREIARKALLRRNEYSSSTPLQLATSVSGTLYKSDKEDSPIIKLFTKAGCTLCDKVQDVLREIRDDHPHSLVAVDITDADQQPYFDKYKYDIPVLHLNNQYWTKHWLTPQQAVEALTAAAEGRFTSPPGEPDAAAMERK